MGLLEKYNGATAGNAFVARTKQASGTNETKGVDFMDAGVRGVGQPDQFQAEFIRNAPNTKTWTPGTDTTFDQTKKSTGLSRWFGRALNYAFTEPGATATNITTSEWTSRKSISRGTDATQKDSWTQDSGQSYVSWHRWTPNSKFISALSATTQPRAKPKALPTPPTTK